MLIKGEKSLGEIEDMETGAKVSNGEIIVINGSNDETITISNKTCKFSN